MLLLQHLYIEYLEVYRRICINLEKYNDDCTTNRYPEMYIITHEEIFVSTNTGVKGTLREKNDVY